MRFLLIALLTLSFAGCLDAPVDDVEVPEPEPEVMEIEPVETTIDYWTILAVDPTLVPAMGAPANYRLFLEVPEGASTLIIKDTVTQCASSCLMDYWVENPAGETVFEKSSGTLDATLDDPEAGEWTFYIKAGAYANVNKQGVYLLRAE